MIKYRFSPSGHMTLEYSDKAVLQNPIFSDHENVILNEKLKSRAADFVVGQPCRMFMRIIRAAENVKAPRPFCLFLHDFGLRTCSSWLWSKFAISMDKRGMTPVLLDLPGFGRSSWGNRISGGAQVWEDKAPEMLEHVLSYLHARAASFVAFGEGAAVFLRFLASRPRLVRRQVALINPILPADFKIPCISDISLWVCFTSSHSGPEREAFKATSAFVSEIGDSELRVVSLITSTSIGVESIDCFKPSAYFRVYLTEFIAGMPLRVYSPPVNSSQSSAIHQVGKGENSFGARLLDSALEDDLDKALKISAKEYVLEYADEDTEFDMALEHSKAALKAEGLDDALSARRQQAMKEQEEAIARLNELINKP